MGTKKESGEPSLWRRLWHRCRPFYLLWPQPSRSGRGSPLNYGHTTAFWRQGRPCAKEGGFLLMPLSALLLLFLTLMFGSLKVILKSQQRDALQSRLDLCAVQLATRRERLLERLTLWNLGLETTIYGIYVARGIRIAGPIGAIAGGASETMLLQLNHSLALAQKGALTTGIAMETINTRCNPTHFSDEPAFCVVSPPLSHSLRREATLFPDLEGPMVHRNTTTELVRMSCRAGRSLKSTLSVQGDTRLRKTGFTDVYLE